MSEGRRLGRESTRERGAWLGQADVVPPGRTRRAGGSKKAIIFVLSVLICIRFRILHCWQTCNIA